MKAAVLPDGIGVAKPEIRMDARQQCPPSSMSSGDVPRPNEDQARCSIPKQAINGPDRPQLPAKGLEYFRSLDRQIMAKQLKGRDGVAVKIPDGYRALQGRNGHLVPIPPGSRGLEGRDGQMVAIPAGDRGLAGPDGRMVVILPGHRGLAGRNGRT